MITLGKLIAEELIVSHRFLRRKLLQFLVTSRASASQELSERERAFLCSRTSEYARKRSCRAISMDTCGPARTVRQLGKSRPTTEQYLRRFFRLSSHLDRSFRGAGTYSRGCFQVRVLENRIN